MKRIKVWIATLSLVLVLTTMVLPDQALANVLVPQGATQPAPSPPPPPPLWVIVAGQIIGALC
jgi:hypothetical protein